MVAQLLAAAISVALAQEAPVDLKSISRSLVEKAEYQSELPPLYCLLVLGPRAEHKVWLVLDGEVLYVDRDTDGELTSSERWSASQRKGGEAWYGEHLTYPRLTILDRQLEVRLSTYREFDPKALAKQLGKALDSCYYRDTLAPTHEYIREHPRPHNALLRVTHNGKPQVTNVEFGQAPSSAPIVHANGPEALGLAEFRRTALRRGTMPTTITVSIGTPGLGVGAHFSSYFHGIPPERKPHLDLEFPPLEPDAEPIRRTLILPNRC